MDANGVNQIVAALGIIHSPSSTNENRRQAQAFLENIKQDQESPYWGYQLASPDNGKDFVVRHFGLTLLQYSIQRNYMALDLAKKFAIRNWVVELASKVTDRDPHYMKEKLSFLWVGIAKSVWGDINMSSLEGEENIVPASQAAQEAWFGMDNDLLKLWNGTSSTRQLSLIIFRTLFEDVYLLDDPIASKRHDILTTLCSEVVTPEEVIDGSYVLDITISSCRASSDGWFRKWSGLLQSCLESGVDNQELLTFIIKVLQTLKTCLHWVLPTILISEKILEKLTSSLMLDDIKVKTLATDCLHILFTRSYSDNDEFSTIVGSVFTTEGINTLSRIYESIQINSDDIDEQAYSLLKKIVELIVGLSEYLNINTEPTKKLPATSDIPSYLNLVLSTTNHSSLIISGLSLQFWVSVLRIDALSSKPEYERLLPDLLEIAANRLLDYYHISEANDAKKFLIFDFDSQNDTNSFLQNHKSFLDDIVRITICKKPEDGLMWLNNRLERFFSTDLGRKSVSIGKLEDTDDAFIYGVSQFTIIEASIRGVSRWRIWYSGEDFNTINDRLNKLVENLGEKLLALNIACPKLIRKQVQTLVQFAPLLKDVSPLMFKVLEKVLEAATFSYPANISDDETELIRDLRTSCGTELNRLAYMMPDSLKTILDDLENVISSILSSNKVSAHEAVAFKSFLLVVSQRSTIDHKAERFAKIVDPELAAWSAPDTEKGLLDLHWFMERLGIVEIADYFQSRGVTANTNLLETQMDARGLDLKTKLKDHWSSVFPIRATRIFIQYSIEKLGHETPRYRELLELWKPRVQPILQHILQLITQIQAYHDPANWKDLPEEVQAFVKYSCMERFWQQGVSIQSKDTFMEENVKAMHTLRDFADSVGHIVRYTREYAFLTIGSIVQLEETFYEIPNIGTLLWKSVAGDTTGVTLHSWRHMINIVLRGCCKHCPVPFIPQFLNELLPLALTAIDKLLLDKWEKVYINGLQLEGNEDDETLSEEMMEEHMLRQLTAVVGRWLIDLVGQLGSNSITEIQVESRRVIVSNTNILAPFLQLCSHIILFKDNRCSYNTILVLRNIMKDVLLKDEEVDKYFCDHILKALITILLDDYFADTHSEAGYALTTLYITLRGRNDYPARVLQSSLPNVDPAALTNVESLLISSKSLRNQRSVIMEFVQRSKNVDDNALREQRKKLLDNAVKRKKKIESDVMEDPYTENGALANLFGDDN